MKRVSPTFVEIDLESLRYNYRQLKRRLHPSVKALCVVKSNAYGHGAPRVAKTLQEEGADAFGVGTVDEGVELREAGITRPILILIGFVDEQKEALVRYQLTPVVYDLKTAERLSAFLASGKKKSLPVHLKVDTGMTRLGFLPEDFARTCAALKKLPLLEPAGLLTHLAEAGDAPFTARQITAFEKAKAVFEEAFGADGGRPVFHLANSQATIDGKAGSGADFMARFGIALYGSYPIERDWKLISLKPVLRWKSKIVSLKDVPAKTAVSYNRTFVAKKPSRIAVVPVGYADGYPRLLSNRSSVLVRGREAPVAGLVCMDLTMIDVTHIPRAEVGDEVVLLGRQGKAEITAERLAELAETISYEIFCRISERVPRVYH